ncbi:hypothetical protein [Rubrobacter indicoceani]|uniref:hypothetical protein n=1 Tax=Rubrobacter indicoceani TaxID=2051957 RepID=UPI000E5B0486|nr:hypothetical protein [Rubrobacter indicoceani]
MYTRGLSRGSGCFRGGFLGSSIVGLGRGARFAVAGAVVLFVLVSGLLLAVFAPGAWWIVTVYGWIVFPALGLLGRGGAGISPARRPLPAAKPGERQLLEALERNGSLTAARASMETTLSVAEAEAGLDELAGEGYIRVGVKSGGLAYSMWDRPETIEER